MSHASLNREWHMMTVLLETASQSHVKRCVDHWKKEESGFSPDHHWLEQCLTALLNLCVGQANLHRLVPISSPVRSCPSVAVQSLPTHHKRRLHFHIARKSRSQCHER